MQICDKLIQLRKEKGYSQEQLANMLHVSRQAVSKWESGNATPELEKIILLSDLFNISIDNLVRDEPLYINTNRADNVTSDNMDVMIQLDEIKKSIKKKDVFEFKSNKKIAGLPLVHIKLVNNGFAVARGIIAIGNVSLGVLSIGGISLGIFSLGGISFGLLFALAGMAVGAIALGGISLGLLAFGGIAVGVYSIGGVALASKIAIGSAVKGTIAVGDKPTGLHPMSIDMVTKEQVKAVIVRQYPTINNKILKLILTFITK